MSKSQLPIQLNWYLHPLQNKISCITDHLVCLKPSMSTSFLDSKEFTGALLLDYSQWYTLTNITWKVASKTFIQSFFDVNIIVIHKKIVKNKKCHFLIWKFSPAVFAKSIATLEWIIERFLSFCRSLSIWYWIKQYTSPINVLFIFYNWKCQSLVRRRTGNRKCATSLSDGNYNGLWIKLTVFNFLEYDKHRNIRN